MLWIVFVLLSIILIAISWSSLQKPYSHGFYRFFAWECILGLFLINVKFWFYKPFSGNQVIAWILLVVCLVPLLSGIYGLRKRGKPSEHREGDASLLAFEKTTALVTGGIYHFIRHPLYSSLFLLVWGIFFKHPSWEGIILASISTILLLYTAKADEAECVQFFGDQYLDYMKHTKMFIPKVF